MIVSRRIFLRNVIRTTSGALVLGSNLPLLSSCINTNKTTENLKVFIPMPVQVVGEFLYVLNLKRIAGKITAQVRLITN